MKTLKFGKVDRNENDERERHRERESKEMKEKEGGRKTEQEGRKAKDSHYHSILIHYIVAHNTHVVYGRGADAD